MFGIIALLSLAQAQEIPQSEPFVPDAEQQSNNDKKKKDGEKKGDGKKGGNGKGKKNPQGKGQKKGPNAGQKGQQGKGNVKWKKYKEEHNVIFRPELGMTSINLDSEDQSVSGASVGLSIGNERTKRLKAANVGVYNRSRVYGSVGMGGSLSSYDLRVGSVVGVKVLHAEVEAGLDLLRHKADSSQTDVVDFQASNGFGVPVQALFISDLFKVKVGAEPRWYFDGQPRTAVDWDSHPTAGDLPIAPIGDEFSWTVGFRSGFFGLSYEQLMMNGGTQHMVLFGLQR